MVSKDLSGDYIVVFDEAHNIDDTCIEELTFKIKKKTLEQASSNL